MGETEQRRAAIAEKMAAKRRAKQGTAEADGTAADEKSVLPAESSGPCAGVDNHPGDCQQGRSDARPAADEQHDLAATRGVPPSGEEQGSYDEDALPNAEEDPYGAADGEFPMSSPLPSSPLADCMGSSGPSDAEASAALNADEEK